MRSAPIHAIDGGGLALALLLVCCGCRPAREGKLAVVVSGDTDGWIVPCGCTSNQSGGLPRRASCVAQLRTDGAVLVADAGGAAHGTSPYDRVKLEAILRGELAMGLAAHNLGAAEVRLGPEALARLAQRLGVPWVSANARAADGRPLAEPLRIAAIAGRRVALLGVLSPRYATDRVHVDSPREAVLAALRQAAGRYDAAIVLAYLPEAELRELAAALPEVDAVVGGPTGQPLVPGPIGPVLLASATNKGKFLARLDLPQLRSDGWTASIIELDARWPDEPDQLAGVRAYFEELGQHDFLPSETGLADPLPADLPAEYRLAGTPRCRSCHEEDCRLWDRSGHARAWAALLSKGAQVDPDCQRCHTTGYGLPGGFQAVRRTLSLVAVGCESCHGPSLGHAADEKVHTAWFARARDRCPVCHDRENSPQYDYDAYWAKIRHGKPDEDRP